MGWRKSDVPYDHTQAYKAGLPDFVAQGTSLWSLLRHQHEAYEVYGLSQEKAKNHSGKLTEEDPDTPQKDRLLKKLGWRFVAAGGGQNGACHVGAINGSGPKLSGFSIAQEIADAVNYLQRLEARPEIALAHFTVRILRVPWLRFEAFWLSSLNTAEDIIIPYTGFPQCAHLELLTLYPVSEFLEAVSQHTERFKPNLRQIEADAHEARVKERLYQAAIDAATALRKEQGERAQGLETIIREAETEARKAELQRKKTAELQGKRDAELKRKRDETGEQAQNP